MDEGLFFSGEDIQRKRRPISRVSRRCTFQLSCTNHSAAFQTVELETIRFACELDPLVANFSIATPFPGTQMYETVKAQGRILAETWDDFSFFEGKARFEMPGLPAELVERKWKEAYRRFYLRPKRVVRTLGRKETWVRLPRTARMAWRTLVD